MRCSAGQSPRVSIAWNKYQSIHLLTVNSPIKSPWHGGAFLANDAARLKQVQVTRQEYQEHGASWAAKVFSGSIAR